MSTESADTQPTKAAEEPKIDAGAVLTAVVGGAQQLRRRSSVGVEKFAPVVEEKLTAGKSLLQKLQDFSHYLWVLLGLVLMLHGAQFKNLFLCTQIVMAFCFTRVQGSVLAFYNDLTTAKEKLDADAAGETKEGEASNKHAEKRASKKEATGLDKDAAEAKKLLKVLDTDKVSAAVFEVCVAAMACHMVMQGGLVRVVVVTNALVKGFKDRINGVFTFSGFEDMQKWTDLLISFVLYSTFGGMSVLFSSLAFALNLGATGAQLALTYGLQIAEKMGKVPGGKTADEFAASLPGLAALVVLTAFGTLWQFWAIMSDSGMASYFTFIYFPAVIAEWWISLF